MKKDIPAVIFAGGKSSRMGRDKALLPFGDEPSLLLYQYHRLSRYFQKVYFSTKEKKGSDNIPFILDRYSVFSPLSGIVSAFETISEDEIFILSVDTPFIEPKVIEGLRNAGSEDERYDALIARNNGEVQPLCGYYRRSILPAAKTALQQGEHKLRRLLSQVNTRYVDFHEEKLFMNLNRPEEYEEALSLLHKT